MPMNGDILAEAVLAAIGGQKSQVRSDAFHALCRAVIEHIQTYGIVITTTPGVTPGPSAAPGTGTIL